MSNSTMETYQEFLKSYTTPQVLTGRRRLYANYNADKLTATDIKLILEDVFIEHLQNREEISRLYDIYKGKQAIINKTKKSRPDINNIIIENNAYHIVEFKKGYVFGEPIQYVKKSNDTSSEITDLNAYTIADNKATIDKDVAEWLYICGVSNKLVLPNNKPNEDGEIIPFETYFLDPRNTFTVYSNNYKREKLLSGTFVDYKDLKSNKKMRKFTIYTKNHMYTFESTVYDWLKQPKNINFLSKVTHYYEKIPIIEYELNQSRLGLIELVESILNALNNISSNDMDDIQQFVQSLLVFLNQHVDIDDFKELLELGGIQISSDDPNRPADIKLLTSKLSHSETKIFYDRLYDNALTIAGVPRMSDKASGGDTGQARLLGERMDNGRHASQTRRIVIYKI